MKKVTTKLVKIGNSFMIPVETSIVQMLGWKNGQILQVPFHEIETDLDDKISQIEADLDPNGKKEMQVKFRDHDEQLIKQEDVIRILDSRNDDTTLFKYRTTYLMWGGDRIGVRNLCKKILGHEDFHTQEASRVLEKLGFHTYKH